MAETTFKLRKGVEDLIFRYGGELRFLLPRRKARGIIDDDIQEAFNRPTGSEPLRNRLKKGEKITIVVTDVTRKASVDVILPPLLREIDSARKSSAEIRLIVATGTHRPMTDVEIEAVTGGVLRGRKIDPCQNDSRDRGSFTSFGETSSGTPVEIAKIAADSDLLILLGSIGFHYHAGFTGGRKLILPGIASHDAALANHKLFIKSLGEDLGETSKAGIIEPNAVHRDMVEAVEATRLEPFIINTSPGGTAPLYSGHWREAHLKGCDDVKKRYAVPFGGRRDLLFVSCGGDPFDINLIQSHKAIEHARNALNRGGVMIVAAECRDGYGHEDFFPWFSHGTSETMRRELLENFQVYGQTAFMMKSKAERYRIILISSLPDEEVEAIGLIPASDAGEALEKAMNLLGGEVPAYVITEGSKTLPTLHI